MHKRPEKVLKLRKKNVSERTSRDMKMASFSPARRCGINFHFLAMDINLFATCKKINFSPFTHHYSTSCVVTFAWVKNVCVAKN